jgi:hypothetical protein
MASYYCNIQNDGENEEFYFIYYVKRNHHKNAMLQTIRLKTSVLRRFLRDILYMLVNSSTFASQAKISIFASQMTRISHKNVLDLTSKKSQFDQMIRFVVHYHFKPLIQQLFMPDDNLA